MVPTLKAAARGALAPDLRVYAGGSLVALGAGLLHVSAGLIIGGLWVAATGVLEAADRTRGRRVDG